MTVPRRSVAGPPEADEQYRARALDRLWRLRDDELVRAGHSTPAYIAARVANELGYPQPLAPKSKEALDQEASVPSWTPRRRLASWCDEDRQIVTGQHRAELRQWLKTLGWLTTRKQMYVLDGITERTGLTYVRELLASEGFEQACDVYDNAGPVPQPRELYDYSPVYRQARLDAAAGQPAPTGVAVPDQVALVLCSRADGFLATVRATASLGDARLRVHTLQVFFNVMILDREMLWAGSAISGGLVTDDNGDLTMIQAGGIGNQPDLQSGGSLRVGLAALRAFARPVTPWYERPHVHFGENSALLNRVNEILTGLPGWVHDLLGPQLTTAARSRIDRAA